MANFIGLVCTGIQRTLHVGCGLTGPDFVTVVVTGMKKNLTTTAVHLKAAVRCIIFGRDFGMIGSVGVNTASSAKRRVGTIPSLTKVSLDLALNMTKKITSL